MLYGHGNGLQVMLCMREAFKKHSHQRLSLMKINIILLAISLLLYKLKLMLWLEPSTMN